jgi:hypothetical protein
MSQEKSRYWIPNSTVRFILYCVVPIAVIGVPESWVDIQVYMLSAVPTILITEGLIYFYKGKERQEKESE